MDKLEVIWTTGSMDMPGYLPREQNEDRQIEALAKFGVPEQNIIIDKASGKDTEREGYQYLKRQILRKGDTLVIKELDRLSRNKTDINRELEQFKDILQVVHRRYHHTDGTLQLHQ